MTDRATQILEAAARQIARRGVRGLRIEDVAADASVSQGLLYYHFGDRSGLLARTFAFVNARAETYTADVVATGASPRERVHELLELELQDDDGVRENSLAWSELRASAKFEPDLQPALRDATADWVQDIARALDRARDRKDSRRPSAVAIAAAERLTSLVEGLSDRWLSGSLELERAQRLLHNAIELELARLRSAHSRT